MQLTKLQEIEMANAAKTKGLGRGLSSLMGEAALVEVAPNTAAKNAAKPEEGDVVRLPISKNQRPRPRFIVPHGGGSIG